MVKWKSSYSVNDMSDYSRFKQRVKMKVREVLTSKHHIRANPQFTICQGSIEVDYRVLIKPKPELGSLVAVLKPLQLRQSNFASCDRQFFPDFRDDVVISIDLEVDIESSEDRSGNTDKTFFDVLQNQPLRR